MAAPSTCRGSRTIALWTVLKRGSTRASHPRTTVDAAAPVQQTSRATILVTIAVTTSPCSRLCPGRVPMTVMGGCPAPVIAPRWGISSSLQMQRACGTVRRVPTRVVTCSCPRGVGAPLGKASRSRDVCRRYSLRSRLGLPYSTWPTQRTSQRWAPRNRPSKQIYHVVLRCLSLHPPVNFHLFN